MTFIWSLFDQWPHYLFSYIVQDYWNKLTSYYWFLLFCFANHCTRCPQRCLAHNWSFIINCWTKDWKSYTNLLKKEYIQLQLLQYAYFKVRLYVFFCQKVCDVHLTFFVSLSANGTGLKKNKKTKKERQQTHNGVTWTNPISSNWDSIPKLIVVSTFPRNVIVSGFLKFPGQH